MTRALIILLALLIDLTFGDPPNRFHPLLLMGKWLNGGRRLAPSHHRFWFGAIWTLAGALLFALPFWKGEGGTLRVKGEDKKFHPLSFILHPFFLKPIFAYRNLRRAVLSVGAALAEQNLTEARRLLSWHLVSRNTGDLSAAEVAGAAIESLAENLTDSLTAPLLAYTGGGLRAAWAYRFINTADAMWGYRTPEFEQLGKFPARLDDVLNWLPARLTGWLLVAAAWFTRENAANAARTMLADHSRTASPNSGWTMSAMAGALEVTLDKRGVYQLTGGQGRLDVTTLKRAVRVADVGTGLIVTVAILTALVVQGKK
ncbi:MAG: cobalamin biosynthesis protein CobD [Anaerolineae bacterium]|nr:cobalamin biosynthesis protein CobD [Anaerolineales bacterium]MCQ3977192.1 cobalamin biosynthesis protein CobD [Anaerolineae bacterium]